MGYDVELRSLGPCADRDSFSQTMAIAVAFGGRVRRMIESKHAQCYSNGCRRSSVFLNLVLSEMTARGLWWASSEPQNDATCALRLRRSRPDASRTRTTARAVSLTRGELS